jgi:hypothetical protein
MITENNKNGYIALFSTIILIAIFLLLFVGMFLLATGGMLRVSNQENSFVVESWISTCAEEALNQLRNDPEYDVNNISYGDSDDGCQISDGTSYGGDFYSFTSTGISSGHTKSVQIDLEIVETLSERELEVFGWIDIEE